MREGPAEPAAARLPFIEFVSMMAALMALNAMAIDIILPRLQEMGAALAVADENARQLTITAYVASFGISQLFFGPISDRFGRRPVLLFGLALYALAGVAAAAAGGFTTLLVMRGLQGIGAGATRVIAVSIIRDTYSGRKMASIMSLAMMIFMAVPIFAPTMGLGIALIAGWRAILVFIAVSGFAIMIWCWLRLPETLRPENRRPLKPQPVFEAFKIVVTTRIAFTYAIATALVFGTLFGFLNSAQQVYQEIYGLGVMFPIAFSAAAIFIAAASFSNARLVERFGMRRLSHSALIGFAIVSGLLWIIAIANGDAVPFWLFFGLTLIIFTQFGFIGTNFTSLSMEPLGHVAGTAASVIGSLQTVVGGLIGAIIGYAYDGTIMPLALGLFVLSLMSVAVVLAAERRNFFGQTQPAAPTEMEPAAAPTGRE